MPDLDLNSQPWLVISIPSDSTPGENYTVKLHTLTGPAECNCKGFVYNGYCRHARKVLTWSMSVPGSILEVHEFRLL